MKNIFGRIKNHAGEIALVCLALNERQSREWHEGLYDRAVSELGKTLASIRSQEKRSWLADINRIPHPAYGEHEALGSYSIDTLIEKSLGSLPETKEGLTARAFAALKLQHTAADYERQLLQQLNNRERYDAEVLLAG